MAKRKPRDPQDDILRKRSMEEWVKRIKALHCEPFSLRKIILIVWFDYCPDDYLDNPLSRIAHRIPGNDPFDQDIVKAGLIALGYPSGRAHRRSRIPRCSYNEQQKNGEGY